MDEPILDHIQNIDACKKQLKLINKKLQALLERELDDTPIVLR